MEILIRMSIHINLSSNNHPDVHLSAGSWREFDMEDIDMSNRGTLAMNNGTCLVIGEEYSLNGGFT